MGRDRIVSPADGAVRVVEVVVAGVVRSTVYALCGLLVPGVVLALPVLGAAGVVGSAWSWTNIWSWVGIAVIATAATLGLAHPIAAWYRGLIRQWSRIRIDPGFLDLPDPVKLATGYRWNGESYERSRRDALMDRRFRRIREPAFRREVRWVPVAASAIAPVCAVPLVALGAAVVGISHRTPLSVVGGIVAGRGDRTVDVADRRSPRAASPRRTRGDVHRGGADRTGRPLRRARR